MQSMALAGDDAIPVCGIPRKRTSAAVHVLRMEVFSLIRQDWLSSIDMDCLLTMMALDDETEDVLDYLTAQGSPLLIVSLTYIGLHSIFPQARWQCAELIGRRSIPDRVALLRQYAKDRDAYVAKRAGNVLEAIADK